MCNEVEFDEYELESGIRSEERVNSLGEVFTPQQAVEDVLDLSSDVTHSLDSKILEPSCGNGNFVVEILRRKLNVVFNGEVDNWDSGLLRAVAGIYGVDIMPDNVFETKERMLMIIKQYYNKYKQSDMDANMLKNIKFIIDRNILLGDTLAKTKFKVVGNRRKANVTKEDGDLFVCDWQFNIENGTVDIETFILSNLDIPVERFSGIPIWELCNQRGF